MTFWASECAALTSAAQLAANLDSIDVTPYVFCVIDRDDRDELVDFAVAMNENGESLRPLFTYLAGQATVLLALRDPDDNNALAATVLGVPLTFSKTSLPPMLLSTMLAVRALDRESGLTQRFLRKCFAYTAKEGHAVRLFAGDRQLGATPVCTRRIPRRVFTYEPTHKADALFQWGTVTPNNADKWARFLNTYGPAGAPDIVPTMLTHHMLFGCVLLGANGQWEHAGVFVHSGEAHVQLLYYGATTDTRLLKFLRSVCASVQKHVVVDAFHERLLLSEALMEETQPSTVLQHSSYMWYAHNLSPTACVTLLGLPMV
jgi:hypothetical protein